MQQETAVGQDRLARIVFRVAGIYGILILAPQYFLEKRIGHDLPPPITHPENYYGFIGVALAWQILYLLISGDPKRYRSIMIVGAFAKLSAYCPAMAHLRPGGMRKFDPWTKPLARHWRPW